MSRSASSGRVTSRSSGKSYDPLNKRIPENPRYSHIKPTVDTGASVTKYLEHLEEIKRNYRYRKDEIFKRLKVSTFAQLILQVTDINEEDLLPLDTPQPPVGEEFQPHGYGSPLHPPTTPPDTSRSTLTSVITGVGEMDIRHDTSLSPRSPPHAPPPSAPLPYLLLDVRNKDDYEQCHIITALSYPATMLSRSCNYFTKEILEYKNKPGRIIILYDEDERIASQAATTFVQREVDNIFMLSGGLKVLLQKFPQGFISGYVPSSCIPSPPGSARSRKPLSSSSQRTPTSTTSKKPIPRVSSAVQHREKFSFEDLSKIQECLDEVLLSSTPSSRATSRTTTAASQRSLSSRTDSRALSSRPWK